MPKRLPLDDLVVGDEVTIITAAYIASGTSSGSARNPSSATVMCYDPDRETQGTATSAGTTLTLIDSSRTEADGFWKGVTLVVTDDTDGREHRTQVTGSTASTTALAFYAIPVATAIGDTYRLLGYPVLPQATATVSGNEISYQLTGSNALGGPGRRVLVVRPDFGTDAEACYRPFNVLEPRDFE